MFVQPLYLLLATVIASRFPTDSSAASKPGQVEESTDKLDAKRARFAALLRGEIELEPEPTPFIPANEGGNGAAANIAPVFEEIQNLVEKNGTIESLHRLSRQRGVRVSDLLGPKYSNIDSLLDKYDAIEKLKKLQ